MVDARGLDARVGDLAGIKKSTTQLDRVKSRIKWARAGGFTALEHCADAVEAFEVVGQAHQVPFESNFGQTS